MLLTYKVIYVTVHILMLPLTILFFLLLLIYKQVVCLWTHYRKDFVGSIPATNCTFCTDPIWTKPHSSIVTALELKGNCTREKIVALTKTTYNLRENNGQRCYRELGYHPVTYCGHAFWKRVRNFKINDRVHVLESQLNGHGQKQGFESLIESVQRLPYAVNQPLWDIYLLHNYNGQPDSTLMITRFHHTLADGMSMMKFFFALTGSLELPNSYPRPVNSMQKWNQVASFNVFRKLTTFSGLLSVGAVEYIYEMLIEKDRNPLTFNKSGQLKLTGNWMCSSGKRLDITNLKRAAKKYNCSIVHLVLAGVGCGLEKYARKYHDDEAMPNGFKFTAPLPLPAHPNLRFVNQWCAAKFFVETGIHKTSEKLKNLKEETQRSAKGTFPIMSSLFMGVICGLLPTPLLDSMTTARGLSTLNISNVAGPQEKERLLAGSEIVNMQFWLPIAHDLQPLTAGVMSCNGGLRVCLTADVGCIPDRNKLEDLARMIDDKLEEICN